MNDVSSATPAEVTGGVSRGRWMCIGFARSTVVMLLGVMLAMFSPLVAPASASTGDPIVGDWDITYGAPSVVAMSLSDGVYTETAETPHEPVRASCDLPVGTVLSTFSSTGGDMYAGQHGTWDSNDCTFGGNTSDSLTLSADGNTLTAALGDGYDLVYTKVVSSTPSSAPSSVTAIAGDAQATVSWTAPSTDGGSVVTGYLVTSDPGGQTCAWTSGPLACTVSGLANATPYTFTVTATNSAGTSGPSAASVPVTPTAPSSGGVAVLTSGPTVVGTVRVGDVVTCDVSYGGAAGGEIVWLRNGTRIPYASHQTYTLTGADYATKVSCRSAAYNAAGTSAAATSSAITVRLGAALRVVVAPRVSGVHAVGRTLTAHPGRWSPAANSYSYRWLRGGIAIRHATDRFYTLTRADRGHDITLRVTAHRTGYREGICTV